MMLRGYDQWKLSGPEERLTTCRCGDEGVPGEDCPSCGAYLLADEDYRDMAADAEFERRRQGD